MPPPHGCPHEGLAYPEVTRAICLVPSASFSQAPWYALPVHLCRFRVRSIRQSCFPERSNSPGNPISPDNDFTFVTSGRPRNIDLVPIDYGSRPRLRGRLTLRGLTLRRNPWTFGDRVSRSVCRYSCQHSHFRYLQRPSRVHLHRPTERSATDQWSVVSGQWSGEALTLPMSGQQALQHPAISWKEVRQAATCSAVRSRDPRRSGTTAALRPPSPSPSTT